MIGGYQATIADALADAGMSAAASVEEWVDRAEAWVRAVPRGHRFTAEDVREAIGAPDHANAFGAVFRSMSKALVIVEVGTVRSSIVSRRGARIGLWERI